MRALIVSEGRSRAALAGARALGRAGWTVGSGTPERGGLTEASRWVRAWHEVPLPERDVDPFLEAVKSAVREGGYEVVFGAGDAEILALSAGRDAVGTIVPYGTHDSLVRAIDKLELTRASERAGLAVPVTVPADDEHLAAVDGPVVVKARLHWDPEMRDAEPRITPSVEPGAPQAARRAADIRAGGGEPILQEVVAGALVSVTVLADCHGAIVACEQQVATHTWPPEVGGGTRATTVDCDRELVPGVSRLLADLGWFGLAQVQFLQEPGGPARVIDLNGRFYGSMGLALAAGPNFPDLWARLATGRDLPRVPVARAGVRFQWLEGDLRRARAERRGGGVRDLLGSLRRAPGAVHSMWDPRDPGPMFNQVGHLARLAFRKAGRKAAGAEP
jgi:predicted ATP-grasp superfamily ATP-dependent carboligase